MKAYERTWSDIVQEFGSDSEQGLSTQQVKAQRLAHGPNRIPEKKVKGWLWVFIEQFKDPLIYLLVAAAVIIFFVSPHRFDAFIITGILTFNAFVGTWQEGRTRVIMRSLRSFSKTTTIVLRNGQKDLVDDDDLVPGDIILLQEGQRIPADARIIESNNLLIDEAVLTGESQGVRKHAHELSLGELKSEKLQKNFARADSSRDEGAQNDLSQSDRPLNDLSGGEETLGERSSNELSLGDQINMLFKGTLVRAGTGKAVVVATGSQTVIGTMQSAAEEAETDMPLKRELTRLSHWLLVFVLITCIFIFVVGLLLGNPLKELLVMTVALFICVVPEGLPVVLTLALVNGVYRMAREGVLVKRMQAVEGLGRTDVIVIDKTGTLTRNEMMVTRVLTAEHDVRVEGEGYHVTGKLFEKGNIFVMQERDQAHARDRNQGFSLSVSTQENQAKSHNQGSSQEGFQDRDVLYDAHVLQQIAIASSLLNSSEISYDAKQDTFTVKGDPTEAAMAVFAQKVGMHKEALLKDYRKVYEVPFDPALRYHAGFYDHQGKGICFVVGSFEVIVQGTERTRGQRLYDQLLGEGLRVLAVATREFPLSAQEFEDPYKYYCALATTDLTFLGVVGITDALRPEVVEVVKRAREAGLQVIMATGDHAATALSVAKQVGIFKEGDMMLDGVAFRSLLARKAVVPVDAVTVYARVDPMDKVKIVSLFHAKKKLVAMTGDGVNDVPSIMASDLGIAMGGIGTEVAKEAADMVLLNDSFASIIQAIEQGRHIFYTLRRVVLYFFVTNVGEIFMILFALLGQLPLPITAAQILWLNLITDGFLDMALSTEPKEEALLLQPGWLERKKRLIDTKLLISVAIIAVPMGIMAMGVFMLYYRHDIKLARTMTLVTMAMAQWFNAWNCRSETRSLFSLSFFSNRWLLVATSFVLFLQLALIYVPFMQIIFDTVPLSLAQWGLVVVVSAPIIAIDELRKWFVRRAERRLV